MNSIKFKIINLRFSIFAFFTLIAAYSILFSNITIIKIGIPMLCVLFAFTLVYPKIYFILFIILRPCLDLFADRQIIGYFNSASIATILLIIIGGMMLVKEDNLLKIKANKILYNSDKLFLLFLVTCIFSFLNSRYLLISFTNMARMFSVLIIVNYVFVYFSKERIKNLLLILFLSSIIPLYFGLSQYLFNTGNQATPGYNRIFGTFVHPNVYAQYLIVIILALLYFLNTYKIRRIFRLVLYLFFFLLLFEINQTYARGAWIALVMSFMLFSLLSYKITKKFLFFLLVGFVLFINFPNIQDRFMDIGHSGPDQIMSSWDWRIMVWNQTENEIRNHPIIGNGLGMYEKSFAFMAHNDYLRLTYETGVLGIGTYLLFLFYIFTQSIRLALISKVGHVKSRYAVISVLIMALLVMSIADNLARSTVVLLYIFCMIGVLIGQGKEKDN